MITKWGLKNFKSIREGELDLAPLTIITGVNSSGKSSLLQSMAMLAQSARGKGKQQLVLKDGLIDLGSFEQIYCKKASESMPDQSANIKINFSLSRSRKKNK
jgi:AAA15 family ATPase/GTPase